MEAYRLLQNLCLAFTNQLYFWILPYGVPPSFRTREKLCNKLADYQVCYLNGAMWKAAFFMNKAGLLLRG